MEKLRNEELMRKQLDIPDIDRTLAISALKELKKITDEHEKQKLESEQPSLSRRVRNAVTTKTQSLPFFPKL